MCKTRNDKRSLCPVAVVRIVSQKHTPEERERSPSSAPDREPFPVQLKFCRRRIEDGPSWTAAAAEGEEQQKYY